jgi:hypothetical protein
MKKGFRIDPDNWYSYDKGDVAGDGNGKVAQNEVAASMFEPAPDNRYPAYAALMSDGRLVTDYRSKCEKNVPVGHQFATHQYMVHNATSMIDESRRRQAIWNGALFGLAATQPPRAVLQRCDVDKCTFEGNTDIFGIGLERASEPLPDLFGTFEVDATMMERRKDTRRVALTDHYEGGRNSVRGKTGPVDKSSKPPVRNI